MPEAREGVVVEGGEIDGGGVVVDSGFPGENGEVMGVVEAVADVFACLQDSVSFGCEGPGPGCLHLSIVL